jgi:hypothetical protein
VTAGDGTENLTEPLQRAGPLTGGQSCDHDRPAARTTACEYAQATVAVLAESLSHIGRVPRRITSPLG